MTTDTFDADGTWTSPPFGVVGGVADVVVIAPPGTAADGPPGISGGGGGGGGAYSQNPALAIAANTAYAVKCTIGADGSFGVTLVIAKKGSNASGATGGAGGSAAAGTGTVKHSGGHGGNAELVDGPAAGGGGGAAGYADDDGSNGDDASGGGGGNGGEGLGGSGSGGKGGSDDGFIQTPAEDGTAPGGAPGGGYEGGNAGVRVNGRVTITYTALQAFSATGSGTATSSGSASCSFVAASGGGEESTPAYTVPERHFMARRSFKITKIAQIGEALIWSGTLDWRAVPLRVKISNHAGSSTDVRVYFGQGNSLNENKVFASGSVSATGRVDTEIGTAVAAVKGGFNEAIYSKGLTAGQAYTIEVGGYEEDGNE